MIKHLLSVFLLYFIVSYTYLYSQSKTFREGGEVAFLSNLENVFSISAEKKAAKDFITEVKAFWNSPDVTPELKELVLSTCDQLIDKKGRPFPDFYAYLTAIMAINKAKHSKESFDQWHTGITKLLNEPRFPLRNVIRLLDHTTNLMNENIIFSTPALKWIAQKSTYKFVFSDSLRIVFEPTNLTCLAKNDSIRILQTHGTVNLQSGTWYGTKGLVTWEQSGFKADLVFARFGRYQINLSSNEVRIDSVEFHNKTYFNYPLTGRLVHKVMNITNPENTSYPRFESYEQRYQINNIHTGFNYEGGFSQHGAKFLGSGTHQNPAEISIFRNDTLFITAKSLYFSLRKDQIVSSNTEIQIHLDTGFIYHPGLMFKYMDNVKEIHLIRDGEGLSRSPYFNTYHNISMDAELIKWSTNSTTMELRMISGASENHAFFESISYFREEFFNQLQGMDAIHPLQGLLSWSRRIRREKFTALDYARYLNMPESQVRQQIIGLSFHGFIGYNVNSDTIEIRERLKDYLKFRNGEKDFDVIRFKSQTPGSVPNAVFDLRNYDLAMNGVAAVSISDHQNVIFFPRNEQILLKKDRNLSFDGTITAGMINLFGNGFRFNYQDFRVDMTIIDSMSMKVETEEFDYYGRPALQRIGNTVSQLSGYLEVDKSDNKSGKEVYPEYPRLTSTTNSYVYYDYPHTQNGAYKKESFYFMLDPFEIDSISRLTMKNIAFAGKLESNIFPVIDETLVVRKDFSLGFRKRTPTEGYPIYGNKAQFSNIIDLSNEGLKGNGFISYVTSKSESEDFTFLPQETVGLAHRFTVQPQEAGIEFPDVQGRFDRIQFLPSQDKLVARAQEEPFTMYNKETTLEGSLTVRPNGLEGSGKLNMTKANLIAARMDMGHHSVIADSADFNLVSDPGTQDVNFKTNNLLANIDFKTRQGRFTSRNMNNIVEFTENRYLSYISEFSWDIDKNDIYLGAKGSKGNRFVSTHRRQDSLDFVAPLALYDVENRVIRATDVTYIKVADANLLLNDGKVTIRRDAVMDPLDSVKIVLNDSLHTFYEARVNIESKNAYTGWGKYDFVNGDGSVKTIKINNITVSRDRKTSGEGTINENEFFSFNKYFGFKGDVAVNAGNPLLNFKGGVQMLHQCSSLGPQEYARFESRIDPKDVRIPIGNDLRNYEFENIYREFFLNRDSNLIYSAFLEKRRFHSDVPLVSANGLLYYSEAQQSFVISSAEKIANPDTTGSVLMFHEDGCMVTAFGLINMGLELEQVKLYGAGNYHHHRKTGKAEMTSLFGVNFMLDPKSIELMVATIRDVNDKKGSPENRNTLKRMAEWMNMDNATKVSKELGSIEKFKSLPANHQHMLVIDSLQWQWDQPSRSYRANGQATLLWIKDNPVNRKVNVKAIIGFSRGGNTFDFYIEPAENVYFLFSYRNGMMQTRSSNNEYNQNVQTLKPEERKMKTGSGEKPYSFIMAPESRLRRLIRAFESNEEFEEVPEGEE